MKITQLFKSNFKRLVELGVIDRDNEGALLRNKRVKLVNILSLICCSVGFFSLPFDYFTAPFWMVQQDILAVVFYLFIPILNKKGFYKSARLLFLFAGNLIIATDTALLGLQAGIYLSFFGLAAFALALFDLKERILLAITLLLPIGAFFFFVTTNFTYGNDLQTAEMAHTYFIYSALVNFFFIGLCIYFLEKVNEESEAALKSSRTKAIQSAKMAALGEMSSGLAHEINTPLMGIQLNATLLKTLLKNGQITPEKITETIDKMDRLITRTTKVTHALQTFAKSGERDPLVEIPVKTIITDTLDLCLERFKNDSIELRVNYSDENILLKCRPVQISQVILNLLNNAFTAVSKSSSQNKWVKIEVDAKNIKMSNSGDLISPELQEKIFTPFFTTAEPGKGTGLGLSISKEIIAEHGGLLFLNDKHSNTQFVIKFS